MTSHLKLCDKTANFPTLHTDTKSLMTPIDAPQPLLPQITSVYKPFACDMVRSAEGLFAIARMAAQGLGSKKITEPLGVSLSTTKRWLQRLHSEGEVVPHRHTQHHRHRQNTVPPLMCRGPIFTSQKRETGPVGPFCFYERAADVGNNSAKMSWHHFEKVDAFLRCTICLSKKQFLT